MNYLDSRMSKFVFLNNAYKITLPCCLEPMEGLLEAVSFPALHSSGFCLHISVLSLISSLISLSAKATELEPTGTF